jgi:1,6-anhydro-N-acetylmuramate kinase
VHAALVEAARVEGTNPNRIAATAVEAWLTAWLAQRAAEGARGEARG